MSYQLKKSTIIYHDSLSVVDEMPDELAGKFVKALLRLMRGEEFLTDDLILKMSLHPFVKQFARDGEAYKKQCEKNKLNGLKGGRPAKTQVNPKNPSGFKKTQANPKNPDTDTDTDTDTDKIKKKHGTFGNVFLSENEFEKLKEKFNGTCQEKIDTLSEYLKSKGKRYKDHYATILAWSRKDNKTTPNTSEWA